MLKKMILIVCSALTSCVFAQESNTAITEKKISLSLTGGIAIPLGNFADYKEYYDPKKQDFNNFYKLNDFSMTGEAKTGFNISIDCDYKLGKNFGLSGKINTAFFDAQEKSYYEIFPPEINVSPVEVRDYSYKSDQWKTWGFFFGPMAHFKKNKLASVTKLLFGIQSGIAPESSFSCQLPLTTNSFADYEIIQSKDSEMGVAVFVSEEVRMDLANNFFVSLAAGYSASKISFSNKIDVVIDGESLSEQGEYYKATFEKNISVVTLNAGVGFVF